jgi:MFS family permease
VNFLFEFTLAGIRTFIILFFIQGLGLPLSWALVAVGIVAGANLVAAVGGGYLADHLGIRRVLRWSNLAYGLALLIPFFVSELWLVFTFLPVFAVVGAVIVTLGFPLVMEVTPRDKEGTYSALFELARGGGIVLGPVVTGAAIDIYARVFHGPYEGYPALWLVGGLATLLAWLLLRQERETTRPA